MLAQLVSRDWRFLLSQTVLSGLLTLGGVYFGARLAFAHQARARRDEREAESFARLAKLTRRAGHVAQALQVNGIDSADVLNSVFDDQTEPLIADIKRLEDVGLRERVNVAFRLVQHIDLELDEETGTQWILANWTQLAEMSGYCHRLSDALFDMAAGRRVTLPDPIHSGSAYDYFTQV